MPSPLPVLLALLLPHAALAAAAPAPQIRPASLQVGIRVVADCHPGSTSGHDCAPRQRSDGRMPVPPQVQALSPPLPAPLAGTAAPATVTY